MIDTQAIRSKILDLAMHGQLTEKVSSDVSAHNLIAELSNTLKGLPFQHDINPNEIPYEVPESWVWCRLSDIGTTNIGLTYHPEDVSTNGTIVARSSNIVNSKMDYNDLVKVTCPIRDNQFLNTNDILICARNGSKALVGKCAIFEGEPNTVAFGAFMAVFRTPLFRYVFYYFNTQVFKRNFYNDESKQINQVTQKILKQSLIPIPPLQEQERIVEKIEQAFSVLDTIDELQEKYADNLTVLKSKLIDAAIQGKLTEQLPEDGTAEDLYQQIQEEKQKLIAEGKIKKEKQFSSSPVYEPYPFDIPTNWKFVRFGELMINRDSERIPVSVADRRKRKKIYDYYGASGVIDGIDDYLFDEELLLIGEDGANLLARTRPIAFIARGKYWVNNHAHVLDVCCDLSLEYICYFINAISLQPYVTGTAQPKMNQENMNAIWVPLPPLTEQNRIVQKLDEILPLCENLK